MSSVLVVTTKPLSLQNQMPGAVASPAPQTPPAASQAANVPVNSIIVQPVPNVPIATVMVQIPGLPGPKGLDGDGATAASLGCYTTGQIDAMIAPLTQQVTETSFGFPNPSTTWVINHNLGKRFPNITLVDTANEEIETDLAPQGLNTIVATFAAPTAGTAYVS